MTSDEIPAEWLAAVHDAYRAAFGQAELNLIAAGLPVVIQAVRPLIEAQPLGQPTTAWGALWRNGDNEGVEWRDDEQDAREFVAAMPADVRESWCVVSRTLYRHATPWVEVSP